MNPIERRIPDGDEVLVVTARYDARLKKSVRWTTKDALVEIRAPRHIPRRELDKIVDDVIARVLKSRARSRSRNDRDLQTRAEAINNRYFGGELRWKSIRWVDNMEKRLGSCTSGGPTDGDIRLSSRMRPWPEYVVDYVIAHELAHRRHANHSPAFWDYLARFPQVERARGFVEGVAFAAQIEADDLL